MLQAPCNLLAQEHIREPSEVRVVWRSMLKGKEMHPSSAMSLSATCQVDSPPTWMSVTINLGPGSLVPHFADVEVVDGRVAVRVLETPPYLLFDSSKDGKGAGTGSTLHSGRAIFMYSPWDNIVDAIMDAIVGIYGGVVCALSAACLPEERKAPCCFLPPLVVTMG